MNYLKLFHRISSLSITLFIVAACQAGAPARLTPVSVTQLPTYTQQPTLTPELTPTPTFTLAPPPTFTPQPLPLEPTPTSPPPLAPSPSGDATALPAPPPPDAQTQQAGAQVEIDLQPTTAAVGELITLTGRPRGLGLPQYTLYLRGEPAATIRYDGELIFQGFTGEVVEFVSASASKTQVEFKLRAAQPGTVEAMISVSGETRLDTGGPMPVFSWSSATSPGAPLTVVDPVQK